MAGAPPILAPSFGAWGRGRHAGFPGSSPGARRDDRGFALTGGLTKVGGLLIISRIGLGSSSVGFGVEFAVSESATCGARLGQMPSLSG